MARFLPGSQALILFLAALASINTLSMDMYLPTMPAIRAALSASTAETQATLSFFLIGAVIGQFVLGPASDHLGRRPVIIGCLVVYGLASLACAAASSIESLILLRIVQAIGGAGASTLARAVVRDLNDGLTASREFARINAIRGVVPLVCPLVGAALANYFSWRANFVLMAVAGFLIAAAVVSRLPETMPERQGSFSVRRIVADYVHVFVNPEFRFYAAINMLLFSGFFGFLASSAFVLQGEYGLSQTSYAFAFSLTVLGYISGSFLAHRLAGAMSPVAFIRLGTVMAVLGATVTFLAMATHIGGAAAVVAGTSIYVVGLALAMPNAEACALVPFSGRIGSAASLMSNLQLMFAAIVGLLLGKALDITILAMPANQLFASIATLVLMLAFRPKKPVSG